MSYARTVVTRMTLDMSRLDLQRSETVTLGDTNRRWEVTLINGGAPFRLPPNWTAALTGIKPDGNGLQNGCSVVDGKIIYDFAAGKEIATCVGGYPVHFDIWDEVGELVASPKVYVNVLDDGRPHAELESNGQYTQISELIGRVNQTDEDVNHLEESVIALNKKLDPVLAKYDHLQINSLQIRANAWINSATSLHYIGTIGSYNDDETTKAFAAILSPMDAETASEAASVGLEVAYTLALGGSIYATLSVKSRPAKDMRFAAVCFTLDNETGEPFKASCAIVGVGSGSGKDGKTPHIGDNGNWWIGEEDTGVSATGAGGIGSIQFKDDGEGNFSLTTTGGSAVTLADDGDGNFMLEVI